MVEFYMSYFLFLIHTLLLLSIILVYKSTDKRVWGNVSAYKLIKRKSGNILYGTFSL